MYTTIDKKKREIVQPKNQAQPMTVVRQNISKPAMGTDNNKQAQKQPSEPQKQPAQPQQQTSYAYDPNADQSYQDALAALQQAKQQLPTYDNSYESQLEQLYEQIVGREPFSYNVNEDALYQQYRDQYMRQGQSAMRDTMGQAQAMTGGYGNSYAQTVGQQVYNGYMQELDAVIPELYDRALAQYNQEGADLLNRYGLLDARAAEEYSRYQDDVNRYWQNLSYEQQQADAAYDRGYANWLDAYTRQYQADRDAVADRQWADSFQYQKDRDAVSDQQWADSMDYQKDRDAVSDQQWADSFQYQQDRDSVSDEQWQKEYDEAVRQWQTQWDYEHPAVVPGSGSSGSSGGGGYKPPAEETEKPGSAPAYSYSDIKNAYIEGTKSGAGTQEREQFLQDAVDAGYITKNEAQKIADIYNPANDKYTAADQMWDRWG